MSWLNKAKPIQLSQESDLPYIIQAGGVKLCFDNCYSQAADAHSSIIFEINKNRLNRNSTYFFRIAEFPILIPFQHIIKLNDIVIDGRIIKTASNDILPGEPKDITVVKMRHLRRINDDQFQELVENMEHSDNSFILTGDADIDPQVRLLSEMSKVVYHSDKDWGRTCVAMLDTICEKPDRKYKWTAAIPELNIYCYGFSKTEETNQLQTMMDNLDINCSVCWA